jgi:competence protein ComGC
MRKLKLVLIIFVLILFHLVPFIFIKQHTIETKGTLYVVNKASKSIVIFDLLKEKN